MMRARSQAATGPAVLASRFAAAIRAILPARSRRARSNPASAPATAPGRRSWRASSTASSMAMEAPWPASGRVSGIADQHDVAAVRAAHRCEHVVQRGGVHGAGAAQDRDGPLLAAEHRGQLVRADAARSRGGAFADTWADHQIVPSGAGR